MDLRSICERIDLGFAAGDPHVETFESAYFSASGSSRALHGNDRALILADARLDNRVEVMRALAMDGSPSDAELILAAWSHLGAKALNLIVGDFAFAIFDRGSRKLILVRDAAGQRPLFYRFGGRGAAFSSLAHPLRWLGGAPPSLRSLADSLLFLGSPDLPTFFKDIYCVPIGKMVEIDATGCRYHNWWDPRTDSDDFARDFPDPIEAYRGMLDDAVRCRMGSSTPVATHLSSGYDSSAVTATAARLAKHPDAVLAFTSVPAANFEAPFVKGRVADEFRVAATVADLYGIRHIRVPPRPNLFDFIRDYSRRVHRPVFVPINISWWTDIRERAAELGAAHILTGQNGNLSVSAGGYAAFSDYLQRRDWSGLLREIRAGVRRQDMTMRGVLFNSFKPWIPTVFATQLRQAFLGTDLENEFLRPRWRDPARIEAVERQFPKTYAATRVAVYRLDDPAVLAKEALIDHGIEENDPTADRRFVEFSLRWPPELLLFRGKSRALARDALADRLPAELLDSPVRGLQSADWHLHVSQVQARDLLAEMRGNTNAERLFDLDVMSEAIDRWPDRELGDPAVQFRYGVQLVSALMAGLFLAQHSSHPDDNRPSMLV
ncbi:asparagine synthase-related protein [Sphingomonas sp. RB1R13]